MLFSADDVGEAADCALVLVDARDVYRNDGEAERFVGVKRRAVELDYAVGRHVDVLDAVAAFHEHVVIRHYHVGLSAGDERDSLDGEAAFLEHAADLVVVRREGCGGAGHRHLCGGGLVFRIFPEAFEEELLAEFRVAENKRFVIYRRKVHVDMSGRDGVVLVAEHDALSAELDFEKLLGLGRREDCFRHEVGHGVVRAEYVGVACNEVAALP